MNRRTMTKTLLCALASGALANRTAAQTPVASPSAITHVDVPGVALALSPDGTMVAGVIDRDVFCVWDIETFEPIAQSEPLPELKIIHDESITWSPDSRAVAWSLQATRLMRDSDIYVFDVESATITNLTREASKEEDAVSLMDNTDADLGVDMFPSWSATGEELLFARTRRGGNDARETSLMRISPDGGEATEVALLSDTNGFLVNGPMTAFEDGSVLYATWPPRADDPDHGVFLVTPDGEVDGVSTGMLPREAPMMQLVTVAREARKASAVSLHNYNLFDRDNPIWVELDLDTGIPTPFEEVLSLPTGVDASEDDRILIAAPAFLTDDDGELTGYLYATADVGYDTFMLWKRDLASAEADTVGVIERPDTGGQGVVQIPRVTVTHGGTAALLFAGSLWTIDIR